MARETLRQWNDQTLEDAIAGAVIVSTNGHPVSYCLTTEKQRQRYSQAKEQGYLSCKAATISFDHSHPGPVFNAYERWCEIHHLPCVVLHPGKRWTHLSFDLIYTKKQLSPEALQQARALLAEWTSRKTYISSSYFTVPRIKPEEAEGIAEKLRSIYQEGAIER